MLENINQTTTNQAIPKNINVNGEAVVFVSEQKMKNAQAIIDSLDFEQMNEKLISFYGWKAGQVTLMHDYYKKWLAIHVCYPELATAPSMRLDEYWHMHILDTEKYMADCQFVFGKYLHHYPYFGLEGDKDKLDSAFELTNKLFKHHFNHELTGLANPCSSTSCR